jgi:hypothetical protein
MSVEETETKPVAIAAPIVTFTIKVGVVLAASIVFFIFSAVYVEGVIQDSLVSLKGGPAFWSSVENGLYKFADGKDLPPEKRAKILAALKRIGQKYGPFLDALNSRSSLQGGSEPKT